MTTAMDRTEAAPQGDEARGIGVEAYVYGGEDLPPTPPAEGPTRPLALALNGG